MRAPLLAEEAEWLPNAALSATLSARALRHLFDHSAKHLDVEWRDLPGPAWDQAAPSRWMPPGPARVTPGLRAQTIWQAAVDLDSGALPADLPPELTAGRLSPA